MKVPLNYQATEFDCGVTSLINAILYLYEREEIPPYLIHNIMKYTLDEFDESGEACKGGTSSESMKFLCHWMNSFSKTKKFSLKCEVLEGKSANLDDERVKKTLENGGVVIARVWQTEEHYIVIEKIENGKVYIFDPYFISESDIDDKSVELLNSRECNRKVDLDRVISKSKEDYSIVNNENRIILLMSRKK